ncbi:helix-turn-helix domain-containing protein [Pseudodesulfovibrio sp. zrk46]|uniref:winged helix-turn-helix transcriptional regulator n=1 Tax=Pseudodesulfovibrio sp. zrk46 TaxID=2725288 RepID=UPI001448D0E0|nr:helix-turn-helix domain-containing protein [Pseudodesulfovibrio sp. zrk46]QJB56044.1 helix-turn-helix transcriptional regulator [Pseudodesulfovibrio sp. zrk46]
MRHDTYDCNKGCPVEATLEVMGGKWKGAILYHLLDKPHRFGELKRIMQNITQHMLTKQLRELEASGLVHREVFPEVPPRVEYSVTEEGESLRDIVMQMREWGLKHLQKNKD